MSLVINNKLIICSIKKLTISPIVSTFDFNLKKAKEATSVATSSHLILSSQSPGDRGFGDVSVLDRGVGADAELQPGYHRDGEPSDGYAVVADPDLFRADDSAGDRRQHLHLCTAHAASLDYPTLKKHRYPRVRDAQHARYQVGDAQPSAAIDEVRHPAGVVIGREEPGVHLDRALLEAQPASSR